MQGSSARAPRQHPSRQAIRRRFAAAEPLTRVVGRLDPGLLRMARGDEPTLETRAQRAEAGDEASSLPSWADEVSGADEELETPGRPHPRSLLPAKSGIVELGRPLGEPRPRVARSTATMRSAAPSALTHAPVLARPSGGFDAPAWIEDPRSCDLPPTRNFALEVPAPRGGDDAPSESDAPTIEKVGAPRPVLGRPEFAPILERDLAVAIHAQLRRPQARSFELSVDEVPDAETEAREQTSRAAEPVAPHPSELQPILGRDSEAVIHTLPPPSVVLAMRAAAGAMPHEPAEPSTREPSTSRGRVVIAPLPSGAVEVVQTQPGAFDPQGPHGQRSARAADASRSELLRTAPAPSERPAPAPGPASSGRHASTVIRHTTLGSGAPQRMSVRPLVAHVAGPSAPRNHGSLALLVFTSVIALAAFVLLGGSVYAAAQHATMSLRAATQLLA